MIEMINRPLDKVQTRMTARVDGVLVDYFESPRGLEYTFHVFRDVPTDRAVAAVHKLAVAMRDQSYDHGQEWRIIEELYAEPTPDNHNHQFRVKFRIKDSY